MKKIAVCFHGGIFSSQTYRENYKIENTNKKAKLPKLIVKSLESFKKNVLNVNPKLDIYIHCWNKEYKSKLLNNLNPKRSMFEDAKNYEIPSKISLIIFFIKNYFKLNPIKLIKNMIILKNTWKKKTNPSRINGIYSRWNSAKKVIDLIDEKKNYDYVFLIRFDLFFLKPIIFKNYKKNFIHLPNTPDLFDINNKRVPLNLYLSMKKNNMIIKKKSYRNFIRGFDDLFLISSYDHIKLIKKLFYKIDHYFKEGIELNNHYLLKYHLEKEKIIKNVKFSIDRIFEIDLSRRIIDKSEN